MEADRIKVGDRVRTGVYTLNGWQPLNLGDVVSLSADGTCAQVDTMSLHGGRPWITWEQISHLRKEDAPTKSAGGAG